MELNQMVYPAPEPSIDLSMFMKTEDQEMRNMLLLVPGKKGTQIPCLYLNNNDNEYLENVHA